MADIKIEYKRFKFDKDSVVYRKSNVENLNKNPAYVDLMGGKYIEWGQIDLMALPRYRIMGQEAMPNPDSGEVDKIYIIKNIDNEHNELEYVIEEDLFSTPKFTIGDLVTFDNIDPLVIEHCRYNIESYMWFYDTKVYGDEINQSGYGNIPEDMLGWWVGNWYDDEVEQEFNVDCGVLDGDSMINHPSHYNQYRIEVIDIIEDATKDITGIEAVCIGNVLKYVLRYKYKNGFEDLKKARFYLDKVIDNLANKEK